MYTSTSALAKHSPHFTYFTLTRHDGLTSLLKKISYKADSANVTIKILFISCLPQSFDCLNTKF